MKKLTLMFAALGLTLSATSWSCEMPATKPELPDAATAVTAQMVKAQNDVKAYVKAVQEYIVCSHMSHAEEKKTLDDLKDFAESFNVIVRAYKARSAG